MSVSAIGQVSYSELAFFMEAEWEVAQTKTQVPQKGEAKAQEIPVYPDRSVNWEDSPRAKSPDQENKKSPY
jgi:hypothetical protein